MNFPLPHAGAADSLPDQSVDQGVSTHDQVMSLGHLPPSDLGRIHLQSMLKLSWLTVIDPSALMVTCASSWTRKLFPAPWPMMRKLLTNVTLAWPFWKETLKLSTFATPVA